MRFTQLTNGGYTRRCKRIHLYAAPRSLTGGHERHGTDEVRAEANVDTMSLEG